MCLRLNRTKAKGKHCRMKWNLTLKRTNTSDAHLAKTSSDQTDLSLNWCASCRAMKEAPRDAVIHKHTCEPLFPLCLLLVVQELKDVLNLLLEWARLWAQCAAPGLSCCGPQPGGWYLAPTHCCSRAAVGQEEAEKRANIPVSVPVLSSECTWEMQSRNSRFRRAVCSQQVLFTGHWTWFSSL